jgi:hypothetical protein
MIHSTTNKSPKYALMRKTVIRLNATKGGFGRLAVAGAVVP